MTIKVRADSGKRIIAMTQKRQLLQFYQCPQIDNQPTLDLQGQAGLNDNKAQIEAIKAGYHCRSTQPTDLTRQQWYKIRGQPFEVASHPQNHHIGRCSVETQ